MNKLEIKTRKGNREPQYIQNVDSTTVFLKHSEDRITVIQGEEHTNIEIYYNGEALFLGDKYELFEKLKS